MANKARANPFLGGISRNRNCRYNSPPSRLASTNSRVTCIRLLRRSRQPNGGTAQSACGLLKPSRSKTKLTIPTNWLPNRSSHHIAQRLQSTTVSRSEEHTSELQSLMRISYAVFCLKKKNIFVLFHFFLSTSHLHTNTHPSLAIHHV